jgi:hypothetical protein
MIESLSSSNFPDTMKTTFLEKYCSERNKGRRVRWDYDLS